MRSTQSPDSNHTDIVDDAFFRRLCEHLGFSLVVMDRDLQISFWNEYAAEQFAESSSAGPGSSVLDLFEDGDREAAEHLFRQALDRGKAGEMEIKYHGDADEARTFVLIVSPIIGADGKCDGASASMRDISQRKRLSRDLANAKRMAALGSMAQGVAHHFNNILGGMLTSIDYVLPSDSPRELRRTLRLLAQAIGRATRITQQLEAFAKSEVHSEQWVELNDLMKTVLQRLQRQAEHADIEVVQHVSAVPTRQFEAQRLQPVLESLIQNAFDAMSGGGTITVSMAAEGDFAVITIQDTGCGIPDDLMDRIFEPFFTTKGELAGGDSSNAGLGLSVVHGLISEIGGDIVVRSKVGEGTEVTLRLPLAANDADASAGNRA